MKINLIVFATMKELFIENKEELFVNRSHFRMGLNLDGDSFHILILKLTVDMQ